MADDDRRDSKKNDRPEHRFPPPSWVRGRGPGLSLGGPGGSAAPPSVANPPSAQSNDPTRQKLEEEAARRRAELVESQTRSREGLRREHEQLRQKLQDRLDKRFGSRPEPSRQQNRTAQDRLGGWGMLGRLFEQATGRPQRPPSQPVQQGALDERQMAEQQQAERHAEQVQQLDQIFQLKTDELEQEIEEAFVRRYFADEKTAEAEKDQKRSHSHGRDDGAANEMG